jgi:type IX secretion system substrate protein
MKRLHILLLVAVALMSFERTFGQALQISPTDTFTYSGILASNSDSHEQNGTFTNNTTDTAIVYWKAISVIEDSTWQMSFCDPNNCYYYSIGQGLGNYGLNHFVLPPHSSNTLRFGVTPYCMADSGKMVVMTWLGNDSAASVQKVYYFANYSGSCTNGIASIAASNLKVYPSPVSSNMTVSGLNGYNGVKITVYDMLGNSAIAKYLAQPNDMVNVNTDALHAGVYILTIESEGTRLLTRRIEKLD